jgi:hypothetical protein
LSLGKQAAIAKPNYAAGARYYVCVEGDGRTVAVQVGQKTSAVCKGANAIQMYYDSGQFIGTIQLTSAGKPATAHFTPGYDCLLAVISGGVGIILSGSTGAGAVISGAVAVGAAGYSCVSA